MRTSETASWGRMRGDGAVFCGNERPAQTALERGGGGRGGARLSFENSSRRLCTGDFWGRNDGRVLLSGSGNSSTPSVALARSLGQGESGTMDGQNHKTDTVGQRVQWFS